MKQAEAQELARRIPQEMPTVHATIRKARSNTRTHVIDLLHTPSRRKLHIYTVDEWEYVQAAWRCLESAYA